MIVPPLLMIAEGRKPRARKARRVPPKEISLHMTVADLLRRLARPEWAWTHFPAGEKRDVRTASKLKRMGVKPGWPDFLLVGPDGRMHGLELKREGEGLSDTQEDFRLWCVARGVPYAIAYTMAEALVVLEAWGCIRHASLGAAHG